MVTDMETCWACRAELPSGAGSVLPAALVSKLVVLVKHLQRSEVKAAQAQVWLALARELGSQGDRYGHPGT
jgi:hypothetical protein